MQTFLPYVSFTMSAQCLDRQRLSKQRVEGMQILNTLSGKSVGWRHHPAAKMWRGYEDALGQYVNAMIIEWIGRGYKNTMVLYPVGIEYVVPPWLGDDGFHRSHQSNLLRKDPTYYGQYGWAVDADLPYVWPVNK
jgi:hypothetical protein